jgi:DNA-binding MarR family transcriptional regulator
LAEARSDPQDSRRLTIVLTQAGGELVEQATPAAQEITQTTLAPLSASERRTIVRLLGKLK